MRGIIAAAVAALFLVGCVSSGKVVNTHAKPKKAHPVHVYSK